MATGAEECLGRMWKESAANMICNIVNEWEFQSDSNLECIKTDVNKLMEYIINERISLKLGNGQGITWNFIHSIVFNLLHDAIMIILKEQLVEDDLSLYQKCMQLYGLNLSPEELGCTVKIPNIFNAAVVELSIIDKYTTPLEKLNCLCTTYDLLFAELKTALISIISKYSEKENDIPVIDNEDIIPVLMVVIIKSKLIYFHSNLSYIRNFLSGELETNFEKCQIVQAFERAIGNIKSLQKSTLNSPCDKLETSLSICEKLEFMCRIETSLERPINLLEEERIRVADLMSTSTMEKYVD